MLTHPHAQTLPRHSVFLESPLGVLRGGGWNTYQIENLYSGARNAVPFTFADSMYGFRVVLARKPVEVPEDDLEVEDD